MADSKGSLPKGDQIYGCIERDSRRTPTYADGRAAHRGDIVAVAGEVGIMRVYKVVALDIDRGEVQVADTRGKAAWTPCHALLQIQEGL